MTNPPKKNTVVFWLLSPHPGRVLRALERLRGAGHALPDQWRLSSPSAPQGLRVLTADLPSELVPIVGTALSRTLMVPVTGADIEGTRWMRWEPGQRIGQGQIADAPRAFWWQKLPGMPPVPEAWQIWARNENLPVPPVEGPVTPYRTIASLERRDLLVERAGTWYGLTLGAAVK